MLEIGREYYVFQNLLDMIATAFPVLFLAGRTGLISLVAYDKEDIQRGNTSSNMDMTVE